MITVTRIDAPCGARVEGVDLSAPLNKEDVAAKNAGQQLDLYFLLRMKVAIGRPQRIACFLGDGPHIKAICAMCVEYPARCGKNMLPLEFRQTVRPYFPII